MAGVGVGGADGGVGGAFTLRAFFFGAAAFFFFFAATTFLPLFALLTFAFAFFALFAFFAMIDLPIVSANVPTLTLLPTLWQTFRAMPAALCHPLPNRSVQSDGQPGSPFPSRSA